jgi:hypothetical protein
VISGTPTQTGSFTVTITATDALGCLGSRIYSVLVNCPAITILPATLPNASVGAPYAPVNLTATGGTAPYTFSVINGALPNGLTLTPTGTISGVPTSTGNFTFTVRATDNVNCPGTRTYVIAIGSTLSAEGGPTLDQYGLTALIILLAVAGAFVVNRFTV